MGGPMGAYDDETLPWLRQEKQLIAEAVRADVPYWGVCLGSQLLAASLGAAVFPGPAPEVGVLPVEVTDAGRHDPVFSVLPDRFPSLQWHSDTYDLPAGAVRLAGSPAYEQQAFVVSRAYGLQFHLEVSLPLATEWAAVPAYARSIEALEGSVTLPDLLEQVAANERHTTHRCVGRPAARIVAYSHTAIAGIATVVMTPCSPKPPTTWSPCRLIVTNVPWKIASNRAEALNPACR
jgi:GMP synthase (glutamine-hydrolysing)